MTREALWAVMNAFHEFIDARTTTERAHAVDRAMRVLEPPEQARSPHPSRAIARMLTAEQFSRELSYPDGLAFVKVGRVRELLDERDAAWERKLQWELGKAQEDLAPAKPAPQGNIKKGATKRAVRRTR